MAHEVTDTSLALQEKSIFYGSLSGEMGQHAVGWYTTEQGHLAERGGFEPPMPLQACRISSAVRSTTLPPLLRLARKANLRSTPWAKFQAWSARRNSIDKERFV